MDENDEKLVDAAVNAVVGESHPLYDIRDPVAFWAAVAAASPARVAALLRAAPKAAEPWTRGKDLCFTERRALLVGAHNLAGWTRNNCGEWAWGNRNNERGSVPLPMNARRSAEQDAQDAVDATLRADGWLLVDDEPEKEPTS